ncbi:MAG: flippase-like domain-containing protein [Polaromonas sp.]|uniref:lysylphosphatidylglycerol synthase transmembrane domain-containing protein n=1 Tax=Polaromonas sp. TaxID=1869339 RepID=UPI0017C753A0|nr:lysylphosphatidylglycerol synthase transmembrane domain-containing protein [Polaromonas sp.]NMM11408.1 flippase-like domain-containing protein [Polaromonas sp.]
MTRNTGPQAGSFPVKLPVKLPIKKLLLVLGLVATAYAAALLIWGDSPKISLVRLWSWAGLQAAVLCLLNYLLRGIRWRLWMAHYGRHFGWLEGLRLYLAGYAFTPTPGNVGEAVRGLMLARNPLGARQSLAIFGAERLADLLCLLLLCLPAAGWALAQSAMQPAPSWLVGLVVAVLLVAAIVLGGLAKYRRVLLQRFAWLQEAWHCLAVRPLVWFALTLSAWVVQGIAVWLICTHMSVSLGVATAVGFYAVAMVAGALSALPAGLGGTEAVLTGLLVAQSATPGQALTITVLVRLLTLWLAVAIGVMALLYSAAIRKDISFR